MAKARVFVKRIKSVRNTKKITRTMELVATAKAKRSQDRIKAAAPYAQTLAELIRLALASVQGDEEGKKAPAHPLTARREPKRIALIAITANRGLCGGYNANVFRVALDAYKAAVAGKDQAAELHMIGKKGLSYLDFLKVPAARRITDITDRPTFEQAQAILAPLLERYAKGELDQVVVAYTHYLTSSKQVAKLETLLPLSLETPAGDASKTGAGEPAKGAGVVDFIWDPPAAELLADLIPLAVRTQFLRMLMESASSEQIARRVAMKNATDSAQDMIKSLSRAYNKARQSGITQQIAEIVGGAEGLS